MSTTNDIYDEPGLESILLPPLKSRTIKHTFKGWKSLALLHSWDDLKIFNTDFEAILKYEKFKLNYKHIIKNEKKLLTRIKDYKTAKAKAAKRKQLRISKAKTSKSALKNPARTRSHSHTHKTQIPSQISKNTSPMPSKYYIKPLKQNEYTPFNNNVYCDNNSAYYDNQTQYYNGYNNQMAYNNGYNNNCYNNNGYANPYYKQCNQYSNGYTHNYAEYNNEITENYVENSPPNASDGICALSESYNSCSTAISNDKYWFKKEIYLFLSHFYFDKYIFK